MLREPLYSVSLIKGEWVDASRDGRIVPYKIYVPQDVTTPKPVIVWSHGFGGNRDGAAYLSRYLAGQGYVLVHITHAGTDSSLWEGKPGHPWDILRNKKIDRATTLNRFRDVPFALDQLPGWAVENAELGPFDFSKIGMSGHSFGALTTQVMAGQLFPDEENHLISLREARFKAGILYSPVTIKHLDVEKVEGPEDVYRGIAIPLLHMTGTEDNSPISGTSYEHRFVVYEETGHPEKYLLVKQGGDHMVYNGTRGKLADNPLRERHEEIVCVMSLAFWDAYLKDDAQAREWLQGDGARAWLKEDASFSYPGLSE